MKTGEPSHCAQIIQYGGSREEMEHPHHQPTSDVAQGNPRQVEQLSSGLPNLRKPKARNSTQPKRTFKGPKQRPWKDTETSALLKFVNLPEFRPQRRTRSSVEWELIVEAIHGELGSPDPAITVKRCKERMKTLTGDRYYKQVRSNWEEKNVRGNLTEVDWRKELHGCGLTVDWYKAIEEYNQDRPLQGQAMSRMQIQCDLGGNETTNCPSSSHIPTFSDPSEPVPAMVPTQIHPEKSAKNQICKRFMSLHDLQRSTLLDLTIYGEVCLDVLWCNWSVSRCCEWLSIVQKRRESAIFEDVIALEKTGFLSSQVGLEGDMGEGSDEDEAVDLGPYIEFLRLRVDEKFLKKVVARNPAYDTRRTVQDERMVKFDSSCAPLGITVLVLNDCKELKEADLSCFRMLRYLCISDCPKLHDIIGWELLEELGWLDLEECPSYHWYPPLHKIPSLQVFRFSGLASLRFLPGGDLDLSGCVRLRTLRINYSNLFSICGLEGLRSVAVLHLLDCPALKTLPDIGHMKDLTHLVLQWMPVEEIKGVEKLLSLRVLDCDLLNTLPDLSHLPHLQLVRVASCPLTRDPSSPYYQKPYVQFNKNKYVDVSDVSDVSDGSDNEK